MKLASVMILFLCTIAVSFSDGLLIGCFKLNQAHIAKEKCVQRNEAHNHCNGRCYLVTQMNNQEKRDGPFTSLKERFEVTLFCIDRPFNIDGLTADITHPFITPQGFAGQEYVHSPFHPPAEGWRASNSSEVPVKG